MARPTKEQMAENLDRQIMTAQKAVDDAKAAYNEAVKNLNTLKNKKESQFKDDLWKAFKKSGKSYDDIMGFIEAEG